VIYYEYESQEVFLVGVSYKRLWKLLIDRDMKKEQFRIAADLSPSIITKLNNNRSVTTNTLTKICNALNCGGKDIIEITPERPESKNEE
jgi:DNA-binding Xre family transcriptional regulator